MLEIMLDYAVCLERSCWKRNSSAIFAIRRKIAGQNVGAELTCCLLGSLPL